MEAMKIVHVISNWQYIIDVKDGFDIGSPDLANLFRKNDIDFSSLKIAPTPDFGAASYFSYKASDSDIEEINNMKNDLDKIKYLKEINLERICIIFATKQI